MTHAESNLLILFANDKTLDSAIKDKSLSNQKKQKTAFVFFVPISHAIVLSNDLFFNRELRFNNC